jgi:peptidylprolyl isomerase
MNVTKTPLGLIAAGLVVAVGLASCGSSPGPSTPSGTPTASGSACNTGTTKTVLIPASERSPAGKSGTAPTVTVPTSPPSPKFECADLIEGTGAAVKLGSVVTVQYVLATYSTHAVIQSSWTSQPFSLTVGVTNVIAGWTEGLVGMKAGGRRELIIPPSLGYGNEVPPGSTGISANDTLVFVIDALSVK